MTSIYESLKRVLSTPLFYFIGIGLGLAFTALFCFFSPGKALWVSVIVLLSIILLSLLIAFFLQDKQNVIEIAKYMDEEGKHNWALKILMSARKRVKNKEELLKIDYEIGLVYCSMEQYQQAVNVLNEILKNCDAKWAWKVHFQLAKALSHTKGYFSDETLEAYLNCVEHRKKFDEYGREDLKQDINLCHEIGEIYRVKKNHTASNKWFRDEMVLRDAGCDIGIKNKIRDLSDRAAALANENHAEDALRQYEEIVHLIENHIGIESYRYAVVQAEMGKLFLRGYASPRYDMALECFQKVVEIKRKYMSDMPVELSDSFSHVIPDIQELCKMSLGDIIKSYNEFSMKRGSLNIQHPADFRVLIGLRDVVINKCNAVLPLFEEVYEADSLQMANLYRLIGAAYKWCPANANDCYISAVYLEKTAEIWKKYKDDKLIQTQLAHLLVDLGGTYIMQYDYESALPYRLEALKTISAIKKANIKDVAQVELALMKAYEKTTQSKTVGYESFLENNGLSTVIEHLQVQHLGNGWDKLEVKVKGVEKEYNWTMTQ